MVAIIFIVALLLSFELLPSAQADAIDAPASFVTVSEHN